MNLTRPYDARFFDSIDQSSARSARIIVPILCDVVQADRVLDVGCGRGHWLLAFKENGSSKIRGIDGPYVDESDLVIDRSSFTATDLSKPLDIKEEFDVALCLEVAEHLPRSAGRPLISALTQAAPVVVFSAAVPGQGGTNHVNEQWPAYWERLFAQYDYARLDPIRRHVASDERVAPWYRQNIMVYVANAVIDGSPALSAERERARTCRMEYISRHVLTGMMYPGGLLRAFVSASVRALRNRIGL
jgi:SAM-dependent methyltransferase